MSMTFNGVLLDKYGIVLTQPVTFGSVERDTELIEIPGRDGGLLHDKGRYKTVDRSYSFYMKFLRNNFVNINAQITAAKTMLASNFGFLPMTWTGEPGLVYLAKVSGSATFTRNTARYADGTIPLTLQPYKYLAATYSTAHALTNGQTLTNIGTQPTKPVITLTGTGNVTLTVGGAKFILQNVTGGVVIDCEKQVVTDLTKMISRIDWVYSYPFPVLGTGSTTITWDNSNFTATIIERWCDLA